MSEIIKTSIYTGVSLALLGVALLIRFWPTGETVDEVVGTVLFPEFKDPLEAQSLEIAHYDEVLHQVNRFTVNRSSGRWVIPSHGNYPADADEQMKSAATSLIGLKILNQDSDKTSDHAEFGVVEPNAENLERGAKGVGVLVSIKDAAGSPLAALIIGNPVKQSPGARYVRELGKPSVFQTRIDLSKLSTRFEDWIEQDLLQLDPSTIEQITFNDYSVSVSLDEKTQALSSHRSRRMLMTVHKGSGGDWQLRELTRFKDQGEAVNLPLASSEELNDEQIERLTQALAQLVIVDVRRKPKELGADLKAEKDIKPSQESYASLLEKGFVPVRLGDDENDPVELMAKNGDLIVETKLGVRYLLRFGDLAQSNEASELGKVNRYLMVACSVSEEKFPRPKPPKLPELPADDAKPDGAKKEGADDPVTDVVRIQAERAKLQKAYEAELTIWREQRRGAADKVRELNARFADWYYVIPEEVYTNIHLGRGELIREKANVAVEGDGVDAFRFLEKYGPNIPRSQPQNAPVRPPMGIPSFALPPR